MKKNIFICVMCALFIFGLSACNETPKNVNDSSNGVENANGDADKNISSETRPEGADTEENGGQEEAVQYIETVKSRYTGIPVSAEAAESPAYMVIVENLRSARPQSGISKADIVFETLAEGGITRYIALFQSQKADSIGPVRSTRPYIQEIAASFDLPFAHCGGSMQALSEVKKHSLMSINEMGRSSYFYRSKNRRAPHNLYTSSGKMEKALRNTGYSYDEDFAMGFDDEPAEYEGLENAYEINVVPSKYTNSSFKYEDGAYERYQEGKKDIDVATSSHIGVQNVVVQLTGIVNLNDKEGHVNVKLDGTGSAYVFRDGKAINATWSKNGFRAQTRLYDGYGNEIKLKSGKTWWYIIGKNSSVEWK